MHTQETKQKISEGLKQAHSGGMSLSTKERISKSLVDAHKEGRAGGFKSGNTFGAKRTSDGVKRATKASIRVCLGSHGFGCMQKGREDHYFAKTYVIRSPNGEEFRVSNLSEWCRTNEQLFPKDTESFKKPIWRRAVSGLTTKRIWRDWVCVLVE